ncbi:MAG: type II toxin-antitoxin system VapC family toxin [Candidatus Cloacimonadota bacterium]|nr:MAG: type II toxin-antitoxin system VapC family toxin [Candidatus Cloacimonadota bacterium]
MENNDILVDTNILIDFFRKKNKQKTILKPLLPDYNFYLSVITIFEFDCGVTDQQFRDEFKTLIEPFTILDFDLECSYVASKIYKDLKRINKMIEMKDMFIAATALENNLKLLTLNNKHFENISEIILFSKIK